MALSDFCTEENFAWSNNYVTAYNARVAEHTVRTVMRYQVPFLQDEEKMFLTRYHLDPEQRIGIYQNLIRCIQQHIKATALLAEGNVASVVQIFKVEQERNADGITSIYLETVHVTPIRQSLLYREVDRIDAVNMILRLAIILRDISREPYNMVIRALDINEVFVTDDNKILLGGFYYASAPSLPTIPSLLPGHPTNLHPEILAGEPGGYHCDMYSLACIAWNLFSGTPLDAKIPDYLNVFPRYATNDLAETLWLGRCGKMEDVQTFRKKLSDCRKAISKEAEDIRIPIFEQRRLQYGIEFV